MAKYSCMLPRKVILVMVYTDFQGKLLKVDSYPFS